jgi:tryptophan synthase alpha chain
VALAMGEEGFVDACAEVGVDGAIVVDLPPEEGEALLAHAERRGVAGVLLAAPTTTDLRLALLARRTRGFLYYVSLTGVTGTRASLVSGLAQRVAHVRQIAKIPVCVGFGVASPAHAAEIGAFADGVVVGSALVDRIARAPSREAAVDAAAEFVSELKAPLRPRSAA